MTVISVLIFLLEASRIYLYMRCFYSCISQYKSSKRIVAVAFAALWIFESFIRGISPFSREEFLKDHFFFAVEVLFLLLVSFGWSGSIVRRVLMAVFLPVIYWMGKWSMILVLFSTIAVNPFQYFAATVLIMVLLVILEAVWEGIGKSRQEQEQELLEQEIRIYQNQFHIIQQSQSNIHSLKHDMKHHIKMLTDMIVKGDQKSALNYLAAMGAFMENSEEYVTSGNEKIDSILNYMIAKAKRTGIEAEWKIQIPEQLEISAFDINVILSNLFENAFHALQYVTKPTLYFLMKFDRGVLYISTKNNCSEKKLDSKSMEGHGYGLKNIQRISEKYHGSLTTTLEQGNFYANILLFLET